MSYMMKAKERKSSRKRDTKCQTVLQGDDADGVAREGVA